MPLLTPQQLYPVLAEAGIIREDKDLKTLLDTYGLSKGEIVEEIGNVMHGGETGQLRLRAAELGAKMQKMLTDDTVATLPSVTIVISDSKYSEVNPILIPRESSNV